MFTSKITPYHRPANSVGQSDGHCKLARSSKKIYIYDVPQ